MGNPLSNFIEPILAVIPTPRTDNLDGMIATYAKLLEDFDDDALELASEMMIRSMKNRMMPLPNECIDACREASRTLELRRKRQATQQKPIPKQIMWTEEAAKKADDLFASHWGERAVNDGVEIALWDFLVQNKRWPNNNEYSVLKNKSLTLQAETRGYLRIQKENGGIKPFARSWLTTMKTKSDKLKALVNSAGEDNAV